MPSLLKDIYSLEFYNQFCNILEKVSSNFNKDKFLKLIFDPDWQNRELKDRMKHTAIILNQFLSNDFKISVKQIEKIIDILLDKNLKELSLEYMFLPEYISIYGINYYDESVNAFEKVTQFTSCEFAVRPFLIKYEEKMLNKMLEYSTHHNNKVRRLASEGSRIKLPWAMKVDFLSKKPSLLLPILENLKQDNCEIVRRSVANSLNDISKDNSELFKKIINNWKNISKETDSIIKHASRTLLKKSDKDIIEYFGLKSENLELSDFSIINEKVKIGEYLNFTFSIENNSDTNINTRIEYAIYYKRKNNLFSKKVFKLTEKIIKAREKININRKQSFKEITTRKFYLGENKISIIVNGKESQIKSFLLA